MHDRATERRPAEPSGGGAKVAPAIVHEVLAGPGKPLPQPVRGDMQDSLGFDFSRIRIHADHRAATSADAVQAAAYTVGRDVVFGLGRFAPETPAGRQLLMHELRHTIQQGQRAFQAGTPIPVGAVDDGLETAASADPGARQPGARQPAGRVIAPVLQRQQAGIPPPPVIFPTPYEWLLAPSLRDRIVEAWNDTQLDDTERGYVVMWNEKTKEFWFDHPMRSKLTITGKTWRHDITLPRLRDTPPVYPVGTFHTHPRPPKGMTGTPGPSSVDKASLLPGVVEDSTVEPYDPRKAGHYFHGPVRRPQMLPPGPLFP